MHNAIECMKAIVYLGYDIQLALAYNAQKKDWCFVHQPL